MKTTVSNKGRIVLPAAIRHQDGIKPGQEFELTCIGKGIYLLKSKRRRNPGLLDWLMRCPVKGWFQPLDRSLTTADIKPLQFD